MKVKNKTFIGKAIDLSHEGKGVVKYENKTGFITSLLEGEEAEIEITYSQKEIFFGRIKKLLSKSPLRVNPKCPVHSSCGGCALQHLSYEGQLQFKKKKVEEVLKRIAGLNVKVEDTIGMERPYFYRNKIQMPIKYDRHKKLVSGFYREKTHEIIPITKCYIENEVADSILESVKVLMKKHRIEPYDEDLRKGTIRHILIRSGFHLDEVMVVLVTNVDSFPGRNNFVKDLVATCPKITTIVQNINKRDTNVILGEQERVLYGKGFINDYLCGIKFRISSKSFYQVNPSQTEKLYSKAIELANIKKTDLVLDAYCGIGTIGLIAASKAKQVIGVEIVKEAVDDAIKNAKFNNIDNANFYQGDAGEFIEYKTRENVSFDVVIMDPPRKGSDERFLDVLINNKIGRVLYVSCDPSTLARDLKYLSKAYKVEKVVPVDMFPMTYHVESVVLLELKKN